MKNFKLKIMKIKRYIAMKMIKEYQSSIVIIIAKNL